MAKKALCLLLTLIALFMLSHTAAFAEDNTAEPTAADSTVLHSETMTTDASGVTVPFSTEPEATYSLAKYPVLTVAAISNYFGRIDAEYNEFTREFTVVYMLKSSKRLLSTNWTLTYDANLLMLNPEKNTIETICPIMKNAANMSIDDKDGVIRYAATDLDMFDYSTAEAAFVRIVFDVPMLTPEDSEITKVDLTVSDLVVTEPDSRAGQVRDRQGDCVGCQQQGFEERHDQAGADLQIYDYHTVHLQRRNHQAGDRRRGCHHGAADHPKANGCHTTCRQTEGSGKDKRSAAAALHRHMVYRAADSVDSVGVLHGSLYHAKERYL